MALATGERAPDFELPGTDGATYSLGGFAGSKAVVVIFSCNHCPYAVMYEDRMVELARDYADRGVAVVAINPNDATAYPADSFENMKLRAQTKGFPFAYLWDASQETAMGYGATRTPEVFVVDASRNIAYHGRIDDNAEKPDAVTRQDLRVALDELLAGGSVSVADTMPVGCGIKWKSGGCTSGCKTKG
jgi:peroxiredoxin